MSRLSIRRMFSPTLLMVGLIAAVLLAGCGPSSSQVNTTAAKRGGTAVYGLFEEPNSLLPEGSVQGFAAALDAVIWTPLFYADGTGHILPGLATVVPTQSNGGISPDGTTYTIHLRSGLKWSDGTPLTAADVVFTLNLFMNPSYGSRSGLQTKEIAGVTATDPTTVVIRTKQEVASFLAVSLTEPLQFAPLPKSVYGSMDPAQILKSENNFWPKVTSGPFMIKDRVQSDHIDVVRNPNYYQAGKPYLDGINFKIIPDQNTILTALQSGSLTAVSFLDVEKLSTYKAISGYHVVLTQPAGYEAIFLNLTNPILADHAVRQALTMSADTTQILSKVMKGTAVPTCDDSAGTFAHEASLIPCYTYNPTAAGNLLTQDGWKMGSDGYRHKNGQTLELRYSTTSNNARRQNTQEILQAQWKAIGIKIDIVNYPAESFFGSVLPSGQFDLEEEQNAFGVDPDSKILWGCNETAKQGGQNWSQYCNPQVDQALNTEEHTVSQSARLAAFHTIHTDVLKDAPVIWLYSPQNIACAQTTLHGYNPIPLGAGDLWNTQDWSMSS